ncbi:MULTISPECIES: DUF1236 domain-containing protein [unclassified Sinorhizobium]|uniref:DUF1236 domain-containing protein n=1 Tax=unclassified Sinorhizobium TaxID=2613772 RepID=UPI0024C28FCD|nr:MULTISPECIES: DUF1236 domain-containing protein [unclassified Sinorhizobium]MDK1374383.1 DUF1236 domain-containing protein [Sinorhizobium sp. 6-70]MDK1478964.1 DUF1236 domain-containing protein [Sinorhizobium sp. 6-117]
MNKFAMMIAVLLTAVGSSAMAQDTIVLPGEVRTYVLEQNTPSIQYEGEIVVGQPVPDVVEVYPIPDQPEYGYAVVNEKRVIVNPKTHTVVQVLE